MNTLVIDTSERRGSIAVRRDGTSIAQAIHSDIDYSSWLLPAVESSLTAAAIAFHQIDLLAVSTGPGSFTGVRIGLCSVKAWAEVYRKPIVGVSRLEAIAHNAPSGGFVTATYDAHRGQVFAAIYRREAGQIKSVDTEMVISPAEFLTCVQQHSAGASVQWLSLDPQLFTSLPDWQAHERTGSSMTNLSANLANSIGELAEQRAAKGEFTDVLQLDANYVRRSDAEVFWKGPAHLELSNAGATTAASSLPKPKC